MARLVVVSVVVAFMALTGVACNGRVKSERWTPQQEDQRDPIETYRIVPGDVLAIDGGKNPAVTKEVRVDEEGLINLIYLGKIKAADKTKSELEREIDAAYMESGFFTESQVSVTVATLFYYTDGQVRARGRKRYMRQITLYQAVVDAGGFTEFANRGKVRVLRPQPDGTVKVYVINCRRVMTGRDPDSFVVRPNDTIFVPRGY